LEKKVHRRSFSVPQCKILAKLGIHVSVLNSQITFAWPAVQSFHRWFPNKTLQNRHGASFTQSYSQPFKSSAAVLRTVSRGLDI